MKGIGRILVALAPLLLTSAVEFLGLLYKTDVEWVVLPLLTMVVLAIGAMSRRRSVAETVLSVLIGLWLFRSLIVGVLTVDLPNPIWGMAYGLFLAFAFSGLLLLTCSRLRALRTVAKPA